MADMLRIKIGGKLVSALLRLAREQGRDPDEITEEALSRYLQELGVETGPGIGRPLRRETVHPRPPDEPERPSDDYFFSLLDRMSSRFDLNEGEAEEIAVEEQHAFREERSERQRAER